MHKTLLDTRSARSVLLAGLAAAAFPVMAGADAGRDFFVRHCSDCHGVAAADIKPKRRRPASDLGGAAEKGGEQWVLSAFKAGSGDVGQSHTRNFKGTDEELQAIIDWLLEQKAAD